MGDYRDGTWEEFEQWIRETIAGDFRWRIRPQDDASNREMVAELIRHAMNRNDGTSPKRIHLSSVWSSEVSKQDGSASCLETHTANLELVSTIARKMIESGFSWFDPCDPLVVERTFSEVRVHYVCAKISSPGQRTFVDGRFHFDSCQMWIRSIQVAACHRLQGVGRQLVSVVEATANALGMEEIRILPTPSSVGFWRKMGYAPDIRSARVFWKEPAHAAENRQRRNRIGSKI